jgi:hypothetical protein
MPAYLLERKDGERAKCVFAPTRADAGRLLGEHDYDILTRKPEWDIYEARGDLPPEELMRLNYWPKCHLCGEPTNAKELEWLSGKPYHQDCLQDCLNSHGRI